MVAEGIQGSFDELGRPLHTTAFVVVDLETTGGSSVTEAITEIGAVKVRGGEVLSELQTLVNPGAPIPALISVLTGITDHMVASAPRIGSVLPAFLDLLADGAVVVAHNAPFDVGFLRAACQREGYRWPDPEVLDTARLARRVLTRDEAPDCKLSTLARVFRTSVQPTHRALDDARATVEVLHRLIERVGHIGVQSLEELRTYSSRVTPEQRAKRHLAANLPNAPGVYLFRDGRGRVLYVGTSRDVRTRVRQYFVASEHRTRMAEMVGIAEKVDAIECAHALEASVRELRLIAENRPRYNRKSKFPERVLWLKLTDEPFPRLSMVRDRRQDGCAYLGPFSSRRAAESALDALHEAFPIRRCTQRLSPKRTSPSCALAGMGRCVAPCEHPDQQSEYADVVAGVHTALTLSPVVVQDSMLDRIDGYATTLRYEEAAVARDRLAGYVRALARQQRLRALADVAELVAAAPAPIGGWDIAVIRHGRLAASARVAHGAAVRPHLPGLLATAEVVTPGDGPTPCATQEEMELLLRWLETAGTRIVDITGTWVLPVDGAARARGELDVAREAADPFVDRRGLRPVARLVV
ncbi:MAG: polymerase subunit epsilon [Frankiales bacterium]|nr:polymerase subunit epsilon [Frankiales bacterium]